MSRYVAVFLSDAAFGDPHDDDDVDNLTQYLIYLVSQTRQNSATFEFGLTIMNDVAHLTLTTIFV